MASFGGSDSGQYATLLCGEETDDGRALELPQVDLDAAECGRREGGGETPGDVAGLPVASLPRTIRSWLWVRGASCAAWWEKVTPGERLVLLFACWTLLAFFVAVAALVVAVQARATDSRESSCHGDVTWGQPVVQFQGRSYQFVSIHGGGGLTFPAAQADAASRCYQGHRGYLATVDNAQQNAFLLSLLPELDPNDYAGFTSWLGASDADTEGRWAWQGGPDTGAVFWVGDGETGAAHKGRYSNWNCDLMDDPIARGGGGVDDDWWDWFSSGNHWNACEPNDYENQDCLSMSGDGSWYDVSCYRAANAFFVEFNTR